MAQGANGLGLLVGPLGGALLYTIGGFTLPFFFFTALYLVCFPFISYILYCAHAEQAQAKQEMTGNQDTMQI